jgi:hypothetical protein
MTAVGDQFADEADLTQTRPMAQRQMHDAYTETILAAKLAQDDASSGQSGQLVLFHLGRLHSAEQTVAVTRQLTDFSIGLFKPERKLALVGKILGLIQKPCAQTAGIDLLQTNDIERPEHRSNPIQIDLPVTVRQHMLPTLCHIVAILAGIDTCLNVVAQQPQPLKIVLYHC